MAGRIYKRTRVTDEQKAEINEKLKAAGIPFSMRNHTQRRCYGAIDIRPLKKFNWRWTDEQTEKAIEIARGAGLAVQSYEHEVVCYRTGLHYLMNEETVGTFTA